VPLRPVAGFQVIRPKRESGHAQQLQSKFCEKAGVALREEYGCVCENRVSLGRVYRYHPLGIHGVVQENFQRNLGGSSLCGYKGGPGSNLQKGYEGTLRRLPDEAFKRGAVCAKPQGHFIVELSRGGREGLAAFAEGEGLVRYVVHQQGQRLRDWLSQEEQYRLAIDQALQ